MMLVDNEIIEAVHRGDIVIDPFDPKFVGTNSYDLHLGPTLLTYEPLVDDEGRHEIPLDPLVPRATEEHQIGDRGFILKPGNMYLGVTVEYTESHRHVPRLDGKSSLARLGLMIHLTAGFGDVGFSNHWTLELAVVGMPFRVYAGMPIAQLSWHAVAREPSVRYTRKTTAKYRTRSSRPQASEMHRNFDLAEVWDKLYKGTGGVK